MSRDEKDPITEQIQYASESTIKAIRLRGTFSDEDATALIEVVEKMRQRQL